MKETLLHQIQMEAVDGAQDLSNLLRKCRILAQRLANEDLKTWVIKELDGYDPEEDLPDYRVLNQALILADYFGAFGAQLRNVRVPITSIPKEYRDFIAGVRANQGVRQIQEQIECAKDGSLRIAIPPEAYGAISNLNVREDMAMASAVKIVNTSFLQGILDAVRNRILNFTLELESQAPSTGDPLEGLRVNKPDVIQHIFNTEIKGNVGNVSQGGSNISQVANVLTGDSDSLHTALRAIGLTDKDAGNLVDAAQSEAPREDGSFGKKVSALIGKAFTKASEGLLKIPASVAGSLLTEALKRYYGI